MNQYILLIVRILTPITCILSSIYSIKVLRLAKSQLSYVKEYRRFIINWVLSMILINIAVLVLNTPLEELVPVIIGTFTLGILAPCIILIYANFLSSRK